MSRDVKDLVGSMPATFAILGADFAEVPWTVVSFTGFEAINDLFHFDVVVTVRREDVARFGHPLELHQRLPKRDVSFTLGDTSAGVGSKRFAMIKAAQFAGLHRTGRHEDIHLRLELVPRAWLLTQRRNSRIFQDRYVHEIVSVVLFENGIRHKWDLEKQYPRRLYCTQYQETDYEFVTRLLAEEGILFYFEHHEDVDRIHRFTGGQPPVYQPEQSQTEKDLAKAGDVIGGIGVGGQAASALIGGIAASAGAEGVAGAFGIAGAVSGMTADMVKALRGEDEAPIIVPGNGQAGPEGGGDIFVFGDTVRIHPAAQNELGAPLVMTVDATAGMVASDAHRIESLGQTHRSCPELVEIRDYDFRKPLMLLKDNAGPYSPAFALLLHTGQPMEQYEHHGEYETPDITGEAAGIMLEQHRRDSTSYEGKSRSPWLRAGHLFDLVDPSHDRTESLVTVRVHHEYRAQAALAGASEDGHDREAIIKACARAIHEKGRHPDLGEEELRDTLREVFAAPPTGRIVYQNFFTSVARTVPYRPPRPARIMRNVTESATVMGPVGQDIYTDRLGRVKVQFHWDREGKLDEHSSVWMRVLQPWAGAGYGFQFFPRVGMEVLVTFIGGDTDRPVVLGSLYNGTHPTPEPLPERMSRSGIRTQSTPQGGGFNELSFEDAKGTERVYLHAERNFDAEVNHSHEMKVKHAHTLEVGTRQQVGVEGEQLITVGGMQATTVGADQASCVGGSRRDRVVGNVAARVEGNAVEEVGGVALRKVDGDELTLVEGARDVSVFGNATFFVGRRGTSPAHALGIVEGQVHISAFDLVGVAKHAICLRVGTTQILINEDALHIETDELTLLGRKKVFVLGDEIINETRSGTVLHLTASEATLQGDKINLSTPQVDGANVETEDMKHNVHLRLTHLGVAEGLPIANTRFVAVKADPRAPYVEGATDADGQIHLFASKTLTSADISVFVNETYSDLYPPEGGPLRFIVHFVDGLGAANDLKGARMRLRNLGYQPGADLEAKELDAATRQALLDFQLEAEIPRTGELDDKTQQKLRELYGS